jgi:spermidine/putrescine transport system substrate-binding protein
VNYKEVIQEYDSFFGKLRPVLAAGQDTGWDLIVMGYPKWLPLMIRLGYLVPLDHRKLPHFVKYAGSFVKNPSYDPGNKYSVAWQSGITGIGYNPKLTGREITSFHDLLDIKFKGKVGMFGDSEDLPNLALLGIGVNPVTSKVSDWNKAAAVLKKQRDEGIVRKYYDQSYIDALTKGDVWLTMAWSGDIYQANLSGAKDLKFVVPKEGGLLWTDCMCIPKHAAHVDNALALIDWVYRPNIAALITEGVHYIAPVPASQSFVRHDADHAKSTKDRTYLSNTARSPLVYPASSDIKRLHRYRVRTPQEDRVWNSIFQPIYQS